MEYYNDFYDLGKNFSSTFKKSRVDFLKKFEKFGKIRVFGPTPPKTPLGGGHKFWPNRQKFENRKYGLSDFNFCFIEFLAVYY